MKTQKPAEGVLVQRDYGDAKVYTVPCTCGCEDGTHNVWVEADESNVTVTTYQQLKSKWWELSRWQMMWTLLTKGYVEYEACIIMTEQQALNYAETLKTGIQDVKFFREERRWKQDLVNRVASRLAKENDCV